LGQKPLIDYKKASELILSNLASFLPPGEIHGNNEYVTINPTRADDKHSGNFVVNLTTGAWLDNARKSDCGGDACSLYAYLNGMTQSDAAKDIFSKYCPDYFPEPEKKATKPSDQFWTGWRICTKGHKSNPELIISNRKLLEWGNDIERWPLVDGNIVAWIVRFIDPLGKKKDRPFTLWTKGGEYKWRAAGIGKEAKWPLYNQEELYNRPNDLVILCEGQKVPSRLIPVVGDEFIPVGWYGGAGNITMSNLEPLRGREVLFPFDADAAGRAVLKVLDELQIKIHPVHPPIGVAKGWDLADAIAEGWDKQRIKDHLDTWKNPVPVRDSFVSNGKYEAPDYLQNTVLHEIFVHECYPGGGFFCFDGIPYTWNGLYWEQRSINAIVEEFNRWANITPGTFRKAVLNYNLDFDKPSEQLDAQIITEKAARNLKSYRGGRILGTENPFSQLKEVRPYWNFPNGMLEIKENGVTWHDRRDNTETFFMERYPMACMGFEYDAKAIGAPYFESTINRLLPEGHQNEKGLKFILQTFAYSLLPKKIVPYYFVCYGKQGTGKSSLAIVLKELAGDYYISKSMKDIFQDQFGKASLVGKLIVHDDDIADDYVLPADIKKLSDGSTVTINEKRIAHFQAVLNVAPWIIGNKQPQTTGNDGHARRAIVMHFSSSAPRDPLHMHKMFGKIDGYKDERPAIMNMVLSVLPGFIANKYEFDRPEWAVADHKEWIESSNPIASFFSQMISKDFGKEKSIWYDRAIVYEFFRRWCEISGYRKISKNSFYAALDGEGIETKRTQNGRLILCYFEIPRISPEERQILKLVKDDLMEDGENDQSQA
jgi:hypothetical protein